MDTRPGTFCSYFAVNPTCFVGHIGLSVHSDFNRKPVPFNMEEAIENIGNEFAMSSSEADFREKEDETIEIYKNKKTLLLNKYERRLFKLGLESGERRENRKQFIQEELGKLFSCFHAELNNLRKEFDGLRDSIYETYFMEKYDGNNLNNCKPKENFFSFDSNLFLDE